MSIFNVFKKRKKTQEPEIQLTTFDHEAMYRIVLEGQAQTLKDIIENPSEFNGITSKKLLDYWLNFEFPCFSNDSFKIVINGEEQATYKFTAKALADFTLEALGAPENDIVGVATVVSAALDNACIKYSELAELCVYLQENSLRVRKA